MNNEIEELSVSILNAYTENRSEDLNNQCDKIIKFISKDTYSFTEIQNCYIVSKALLFVLNRLNKSNDIYKDTVLVIYYNLLRCILKNESNNNDRSEKEFAASSALAFILLSNNNEFIGGEIFRSLVKDPQEAVNNVIAQLSVFYWNYKLSPIQISFEEEINAMLRKVESEWKNIIYIPDDGSRIKVILFVKDNMEVLVRHLKSILIDLNSEDSEDLY